MIDYDLDCASENEGEHSDQAKQPTKCSRETIDNSNWLAPTISQKRGRGRPRRYPRPGDPKPTQICAILVPCSNGNSASIAPLQGSENSAAIKVGQGELENSNDNTVIESATQDRDQTDIGATTNISCLDDSIHPVPELSLSYAHSSLASKESSICSVTSLSHMASPNHAILPSYMPSNLNNEEGNTNDRMDRVTKDCQIVNEVDNSDQRTDGTNNYFGRDETKIQRSIDAKQTTIYGLASVLKVGQNPKKDPIPLGVKSTKTQLENLKCPVCKLQTYFEYQFRRHLEVHKNVLHGCKCCTHITTSESALHEHYKENHPACICAVCNFVCERAFQMRRHMTRHDSGGWKCEICNNLYKDPYILKTHMKMVHEPADVMYDCSVCGKAFSRKANLKRHVRLHSGEKLCKCLYCDYAAVEKCDIKKHSRVHEDPQFWCLHCNMTFRQKRNMELHVKRRHDGEKDYKCGMCNYYGFTYTDIRRHIERKHPTYKVASKNQCPKCGVKGSQASIKEHMKFCKELSSNNHLSGKDGGISNGIQHDGEHIGKDLMTMQMLNSGTIPELILNDIDIDLIVVDGENDLPEKKKRILNTSHDTVSHEDIVMHQTSFLADSL